MSREGSGVFSVPQPRPWEGGWGYTYVCVCLRVCVITKSERFWALQRIKYSVVFLCGGSAAGQ